MSKLSEVRHNVVKARRFTKATHYKRHVQIKSGKLYTRISRQGGGYHAEVCTMPIGRRISEIGKGWNRQQRSGKRCGTSSYKKAETSPTKALQAALRDLSYRLVFP